MSSNKEGQDNLSKFGFYLLVVILCIQTYIFTYPLMKSLGLDNKYINMFIVKLIPELAMFQNVFIGKIIVLGIDFFVVLIALLPKKKQEVNVQKTIIYLLLGLVLFFASNLLVLKKYNPNDFFYALYIALTLIGLILIHGKILLLKKLVQTNILKDRFNREAAQFLQTTEKIETKYSVNIPIEFQFEGKTYKGYINYINLFRALAVTGVPGSGKSYAIIEEIIKQFIQKGFSLYVYDYKYPTLSIIVYNYLLKYYSNYKNKQGEQVFPKYYVINFDKLENSNRCNPLAKKYLTDMTDAVESSKTLMFALNRTWAKKDGDFFPESAVNFVACCMWVLRCIKGGKFSTFPHLIELVSLQYDQLFPILSHFGDNSVNNMLAPYISAYEAGSVDQLEGQIGTVRIALSRLTSPILYWIMSKDEVPFQINDPNNPAIFCVGNSPQRRQIYGAAISLIQFRVLQLVNKQNMNPCGIIIDELPTVYPGKGVIDDLIGTGRSNLIATVLGFQDTTQMVRDLGKESADAIINTVGNLASGTVLGTTADALSKRMGKVKIKKESLTINSDSTSVNIAEELVDVLPPSEISNLTQGTLFGIVADEFNNVIEEKRFIGKVILDKSDQTKHPIPQITEFRNYEETDQKRDLDDIIKEQININSNRIRQQIKDLAIEVEDLLEEEEEENLIVN